MSFFNDAYARRWNIEFDDPRIRRVRSELGIDLTDGQAYLQMAADTRLHVNAIWLLCESQAEQRGIGEIEFARALQGGAIDRATTALIDASRAQRNC